MHGYLEGLKPLRSEPLYLHVVLYSVHTSIKDPCFTHGANAVCLRWSSMRYLQKLMCWPYCCWGRFKALRLIRILWQMPDSALYHSSKLGCFRHVRNSNITSSVWSRLICVYSSTKNKEALVRRFTTSAHLKQNLMNARFRQNYEYFNDRKTKF